MTTRKTLLSAALAAAVMAAASAGAQDRNPEAGNRGVQTPASAPEPGPVYNQGIPAGQNAIPSSANPMNPNEARPFVQQPEGVRPLVRGDNPNLPNPVTPSAGNESAAQPKLREPTNMTGMEGQSGVGATR